MEAQDQRSGHLPSINEVSIVAPFRWLVSGWSDFTSALGPCLVYGFAMAAVSLVLTLALLFSGYADWIMVLIGGFFFVAPMLAMGLYEAARLLEEGERPKLGQMMFVRTASTLDLSYLGLALVMLYFLWTRVGQVVYGLSTYQVHHSVIEFLTFMFSDPDGWNMIITGTIIGGVIAFFTYSIVVISAPMLMNQSVGVFVAIISSVRSVVVNFLPMLVWAGIILVLTLLSVATGFLAMIVVFPVVGLGTWRAYRELVPSSGYT